MYGTTLKSSDELDWTMSSVYPCITASTTSWSQMSRCSTYSHLLSSSLASGIEFDNLVSCPMRFGRIPCETNIICVSSEITSRHHRVVQLAT